MNQRLSAGKKKERKEELAQKQPVDCHKTGGREEAYTDKSRGTLDKEKGERYTHIIREDIPMRPKSAVKVRRGGA